MVVDLGLVADPSQCGRLELPLTLDARLKREVEYAAYEHRLLHRIRRDTCFEHLLDILYETAEVMMRPPFLQIHQHGDWFRRRHSYRS